jgi:hypothetical protein
LLFKLQLVPLQPGKEMRDTFVPEALSEVVGMMLSGGGM